jgi:hypothetical protein
MTSPGKVQVSAGATGGPSRTFDYREDGRVFTIEWDPRETGAVISDRFERWSAPPGEALDPATRERIFDALWAAAQAGGITAIIDESSSLACLVPVRWNRGADGFLVDVHDGGRLEYMELGRGLMLRYREEPGRLYVAFVQWPRAARWTEPDEAVAVDHAARIRDRLAGATPRDVRLGANLPWKLVVEPEAAA